MCMTYLQKPVNPERLVELVKHAGLSQSPA